MYESVWFHDHELLSQVEIITLMKSDVIGYQGSRCHSSNLFKFCVFGFLESLAVLQGHCYTATCYHCSSNHCNQRWVTQITSDGTVSEHNTAPSQPDSEAHWQAHCSYSTSPDRGSFTSRHNLGGRTGLDSDRDGLPVTVTWDEPLDSDAGIVWQVTFSLSSLRLERRPGHWQRGLRRRHGGAGY
jgi:hypothetical protein